MATNLLHQGQQGVCARSTHELHQPDLHREFHDHGTCLGSVLADAWNHSSPIYKRELLDELRKHDLAIDRLLRYIVSACMYEGEFMPPEVSEQQVTTTAAAPQPPQQVCFSLEEQPFDVIAASYLHFRKQPQAFCWQLDEQFHASIATVDGIFCEVLKAVVGAAWQHAVGVDILDIIDSHGDKEDMHTRSMPTSQLMELLEECSAAQQVRWERNHDGTHPLQTRNTDQREKLLALLEQAIEDHVPYVESMRTLAKVAITHVRQSIRPPRPRVHEPKPTR